MATTPEGLAVVIDKMRMLMKSYGSAALHGDPEFLSMLEKQRKQRLQEFALDVLERQLRPQAEDAFRRKDYVRAAELYASIRERLSPAEARKLALAKARK